MTEDGSAFSRPLTLDEVGDRATREIERLDAEIEAAKELRKHWQKVKRVAGAGVS